MTLQVIYSRRIDEPILYTYLYVMEGHMLNISYTFRFWLTLLAVCFTCFTCFTCHRCDFVSKSVYKVANLAYTSSCDDSLRLQAEGFWSDTGVSSNTAR